MSLNYIRVKSEFFRNVVTLIFGTTIAQLLPILISPILTRAYTPEEFGVFAMFITLGTILGTIATGRYELAIMLPKTQRKALSVAILSVVLTTLVCFIAIGFFYGFRNNIAYLLDHYAIAPWLLLVPLYSFFYGNYQVVNYWHNRHIRFKTLSLSRVLQSFVTCCIQLIAGIFHLGIGGLIIGLIIGQCTSFLWLFICGWMEWKTLFDKLHLRRVLFEGRKYISFPLIDGPTSLLNVLSSQLPNILFAILFSPTAAGYYFLTQRILQAPVTL
ncbi:O180 family O-antigen flippase, partial [Escherichia marmotae]|nr:O180 family O-antigen flippase [Escherichia marmotae]